MITFLFWNINRRPIAELVAALAHSHGVDVLMLAESDIPDDYILSALNKGQKAEYVPDTGLSERLRLYTRYIPPFVQAIEDSGGISIRHIQPPLISDILLVAVHLPSKLYQKTEDYPFFCRRLANKIDSAERVAGHSRTVVVGDFNMNPFEYGFMVADGLHAVMDRRIAGRGFRSIQGENRQFLYNPMWSFLGDHSAGPAGTYFRDTGTPVNFFWNMFDQVLIRPQLLQAFRNEDLMIVTEVGPNSLLDDYGRPDIRTGSDHLPILFRLHL